MTNEGTPARPLIYKKIVKERYALSKYCNIPYKDTLDITPLERKYLMDFWKQDVEMEQKAMEEQDRKRRH